MEFAVSTQNLTRKFGEVCAVDNLNLDVKQGEIFGLIGPNGAGKTTTIRMLTTLLNPTSGTALVLGHDIAKSPILIRRKISVLQQRLAIEPDIKVEEDLYLYARLNETTHIPRSEIYRRVDQVIEELGLERYRKTPAKFLSLGFRRKLQLARALVREADLYFLDEPTVGLDTEGVRTTWAKLKSLVKSGKTIFLTTHNEAEIQNIPDRIGFMVNGNLLELSTPSALMKGVGNYAIEIELGKRSDLSLKLDNIPHRLLYERGNYILVTCASKKEISEAEKSLMDQLQHCIFALKVRKTDIGDAFLMFSMEG